MYIAQGNAARRDVETITLTAHFVQYYPNVLRCWQSVLRATEPCALNPDTSTTGAHNAELTCIPWAN